MNGKYLLDTNIVIAFFAEETEVIEKLKTSGKFYVPGVVVENYFSGKPLPENDIWIAAIALRNNCTVVSRDEHFKEVDTLKIEKW